LAEKVIIARIQASLVDGQLPCLFALAIAHELGVPPLEVGHTATTTGVRISRCQLGLFGYGPKAEGKSKIVQAMPQVPDDLAARLHAALNPAGHLTCAAAFAVAQEAQRPRLEIANAAQALDIHVTECQLGCFT
jgi:hypothetical protein